MCPIKILVCGIFWLRQPRCSWHIMTLGSINCEFCASKWLLVFKNFLLLLKLAFDFDPLILQCVRCARAPSFVSLCLVTSHSCFVAVHVEKAAWSSRLHCLRSHTLPSASDCSQSLLGWCDCVSLPVTLPILNGLSSSAFKISPLLLSSLITMGLSYTQSSPCQIFPQYFAENTKQKCHFKRGVFFFSFRM